MKNSKSPSAPLSILPPGLAALDLGTNTFRLVSRGIQLVEYPRIGRGVDKLGRLAPSSIRRGLTALAKFAREVSKRKLRVVGVVGTSALRDAKNAADFCETVRRRFGWDIAVLSGEEEAELTFFGAMASLKNISDIHPRGRSSPLVLVSDVGGGSTELIWGRPAASSPGILGRVSLNMGSVRMTERFKTSGSVPPTRLKKLVMEVRAMLKRTGVPWGKIGAVVGVGGTATTLSAILYGVVPYDEKQVHGSRVPFDSLEKMLDVLSIETPRERMDLPSVPRGRADIIVAGTAIQTEIVRCAPSVSRLIVSDAGILTGLILKRTLLPR